MKYVLHVDSAQRTGVTLGQGGRKERRRQEGDRKIDETMKGRVKGAD